MGFLARLSVADSNLGFPASSSPNPHAQYDLQAYGTICSSISIKAEIRFHGERKFTLFHISSDKNRLPKNGKRCTSKWFRFRQEKGRLSELVLPRSCWLLIILTKPCCFYDLFWSIQELTCLFISMPTFLIVCSLVRRITVCAESHESSVLQDHPK